MPEKRLGLDIQSDAVRAVVMKAGLKPGVAAHAFVRLTPEMAVETAVSQVLERLSAQTSLEKTPCNVSFGNDRTAFRNISIPFSEPKKVRQVLPFELENEVPFRVEDVIADYHVIEKSDHTKCIAAASTAEAIEDELELVSTRGLSAEVIAPSGVHTALGFLAWGRHADQGIFLDMGPDRSMLAFFSDKKARLVRNIGQNFENRPQSLAMEISLTLKAWSLNGGKGFSPEKIYITGSGAMAPETRDALAEILDLPVEKIDLAAEVKAAMEGRFADNWEPMIMDGALALAMFQPGQTSGFNMRQGRFAVRGKWEAYKGTMLHAGILLVVLLSVLCVNYGVDVFALKKQARNLESQVEELFSQALPGADSGGDPVGTLLGEIQKIDGSGGLPGSGDKQVKVIDVLDVISSKIPQSIDIKVTKLMVNPDEVQIHGETDSFQAANEIMTALESSPFFRKVSLGPVAESANSQVKRFHIKAQINKNTGEEK